MKMKMKMKKSKKKLKKTLLIKILMMKILILMMILITILMLLLMYKTAFKIRHPVNTGLLPIIARRDSAHAPEMAQLSGSLEFLKNLRNAYRLSVGAEDTLRPEYFDIVAAAMRVDYMGAPDAGDRLLAEYREHTASVAGIVTGLSAELESALVRGDV